MAEFTAAMAMPSSGMTMRMPLLPDWLRWLWVIALCVVLVLHAWHVWSMSGRARWWHVGHTVMAAGMIVMYLVRQPGHAGLYWGGVALYGVLTVVMATGGAMFWRRDRLLNWLWAASSVDMLAMTYMALPSGERDAGLTYVFVAYLLIEMVLWLSDPLPRLFARQVTALMWRRPNELAAAGSSVGGDARTVFDGGTVTQAPARPVVSSSVVSSSAGACESMRLVADVTFGVRTTLVVMSAAMAWMLIAMQTMQMTGGSMPSMHM